VKSQIIARFLVVSVWVKKIGARIFGVL